MVGPNAFFFVQFHERPFRLGKSKENSIFVGDEESECGERTVKRLNPRLLDWP